MSWLARSIANSLKLDNDEDDNYTLNKPQNPQDSEHDVSSPTSPSTGVKEDLSELTKTLTRQFWGVASFLAPPPPQSEQRSDQEVPEPDSDSVTGIRHDFAEIGGKFRSGISRISNNINVSDITKMASNFLQLDSDEDDEEERKREGFDSLTGGAVGVTEEVVAFARDIAMHPETWLDFPLPENDGEDSDFDMSDAQQEHALAVEKLAPRLAALRIELSPGYMSESSFWKIYFVLVHPRLDRQDAELLSTTQIVKARAFLAQELKSRSTSNLEDSEKAYFDPHETDSAGHQEPFSVPLHLNAENERNKASNDEIRTSSVLAGSETANSPVERKENEQVGKSLVEEKDIVQGKDQDVKSVSLNASVEKDEDDADDWLKEENVEIGGPSGLTIPIENEEDVSFSDLEEDDADAPPTYRKSNYSSDKDSRDWVQLGKTSSDSSKEKHSDNESVNTRDNKESNDWLDIEDIDVA